LVDLTEDRLIQTEALLTEVHDRDASARPALGGFGDPLKLDVRSLDHLLQVDDKLGIHRIVGGSEGIQRRRAGGVEDPEHAQLVKGAFVDTRVFLLRGGRNLRQCSSLVAQRSPLAKLRGGPIPLMEPPPHFAL